MSLFVDIQKNYGDFHLDVKFSTEGGMLGLLGASGCGKSLTLKCIAGIETPDAGKIVLNGVTLFDKEQGINLPPQKRKVGYLFQNYSLFPNMTLRKNILCGGKWEKNKAKREQMADDMIAKMRLQGLENHHPAQLSGGQQQRTALARILINQPDIILLDEPFSALDAYLKDQLQVEMKQILREYNKEVIMVSHSRDEIYRLCDQVAIVHSGRVQEKGAVKEVFAHPKTVQAAILTGCKNIAPAIRKSAHEVEVPSWKVTLQTADEVREDVCAVGLRAHYFNATTRNNQYPVELVEEIEEPFEWTLKFRYAEADADAPAIWWRMSKDKKGAFPESLGIAPVNVMPLYE